MTDKIRRFMNDLAERFRANPAAHAAKVVVNFAPTFAPGISADAVSVPLDRLEDEYEATLARIEATIRMYHPSLDERLYAPLLAEPGHVRVRQYTPNFMSGFEQQPVSLPQRSDLSAIPWAGPWSDDGFELRTEPYGAEWVVTAHKDDKQYVVAFTDKQLEGSR